MPRTPADDTPPLAAPQPADPAHYMKNAGIVLVNADGLVWAGERADVSGAWQLPQGGMEDGEDILATARRELLEETGIPRDAAELLAIHPHWLTYDWPEGARNKQKNMRGKTQKWFLFRYTGRDRDIDLANVDTPEFSRWRWMTPSDLLAGAVDFRKPVYEAVFKAFAERLRG